MIMRIVRQLIGNVMPVKVEVTATCCRKKKRIHGVESEVESDDTSEQSSDECELAMQQININTVHGKLFSKISINKKLVTMEVDSGASVSILSKDKFDMILPNCKLQSCPKQLLSVCGNKLKVAGQTNVRVTTKNKQKVLLPLVIINEKNVSLLGRPWLDVLVPEWRQNLTINRVKVDTIIKNMSNKSLENSNSSNSVNNEKSKFKTDENNCIKHFLAQIVLKDDALPVFHKAYSVPISQRELIEKEIKRLVKENIISPVRHSEWASPMAGGKQFTIIDLKNAYLQLKVQPNCKKYLTINTHLGLFEYNRLPFGVTSAPSIFQSIMDQILKDIPMTACYIDDVIVAGRTLEELKKNVDAVCKQLENYNVIINYEKSQFNKLSVEFLGYKMDANGIHPVENKIEALMQAPAPTNLTELRSYLGFLNYYHKFIPNASTLLQPLYDLERKDIPFHWSKKCQKAFNKSKV
nr:uncharacterized protein K02A2.6-like [Onthophagus taurus]